MAKKNTIQIPTLNGCELKLVPYFSFCAGTSVKSKVIAPDYKDRKAGSGRKNSDDSEDSDVEPLSEEHRGRGFRRGAAAGNPLSPLACLGLTPAKLGCLPVVE